jgi:hypothetical protein
MTVQHDTALLWTLLHDFCVNAAVNQELAQLGASYPPLTAHYMFTTPNSPVDAVMNHTAHIRIPIPFNDTSTVWGIVNTITTPGRVDTYIEAMCVNSPLHSSSITTIAWHNNTLGSSSAAQSLDALDTDGAGWPTNTGFPDNATSSTDGPIGRKLLASRKLK